MTEASTPPALTEHEQARLRRRVDDSAGPEGCWLPRPRANSGSPPQFTIDEKKYRLLHVVWREVRGSWPTGYLFRRCESEGCINSHHFSRYGSVVGPTSSEPLNAALDRAGLTLREAADRAGTTVTHITQSLRADHYFYRDTLESLIEVLDAPELLTEITAYHRSYKMTCRDCGQVNTLSHRGLLRNLRRDDRRKGKSFSGYANAEIDWAAGSGSYKCGPCTQRVILANAFEMQDATTKQRIGKPRYFKKRMEKMRAARQDPAAAQRKATHAAAEAAKARRCDGRRVSVLGKFRPTLKMYAQVQATDDLQYLIGRQAFWFCESCVTLGDTRPAKPVVIAHRGTCHAQRMSTSLDTPIAGRPGWHRSSIAVTAAVAMTVLKVIHRLDVGEYSFHDGLPIGTGIANTFGLSRRTVYNRIRFVLDHLPPRDVGSQRVQRLADTLRAEAAGRF